MKKRITAFAMALAMVAGTVAMAAGVEQTISVTPMNLTVNGQQVTPTGANGAAAGVFASQGVTYAPVRYLCELLGIEVEWDKNDPGTVKLAGDITVPVSGEAKSGTFTAAAKGFGGDVTVSLTLADGALADVKVAGDKETAGIGSRAVELMPGTMLAANSIAVDGISGATVTSGAILAAAKEALAASGAALEAKAVEIEQHMTPGTYTGAAYGKWKEGTIEGGRFGSPKVISPTTVTVKVDETKILSVTVDSCDDTPGFIELPMEQLPKAIVEQQSIAVDAVAGCTLTSQAVLSGVQQALEAAGANITGFMKAAPRSTATEEYTCDVAVVGAGGCGTTAALTLQQAGLNVIVVEKTAKVGGESVCSTGAFTPGSKYLETIIDDKSLITDPGVFFDELMDYSHWTADSTVVRAFLDRAGETADWLQTMWDQTDDPGFGKVGMKGKNGLDTGKGTKKYQVLYDDFFLPGGGKLLLSSRAYELITDASGAVVGVKARKTDGTEVVVHANQVVLATGGFAGSPELLDQYFHNTYYLNGLSTCEGDGMLMAQAVGAGHPQNLDPHLAEFCSNDVVDFYAGYMKNINYSGLLQLNTNGERFYNEEFGASDPLAKGAAALNTVGEAYAIFSQRDLDLMEEGGCKSLISQEVRDSMVGYRDRACVPFTTIKTEMQNAIDAGQGWKADTLTELGKKVGVFNMEVYNAAIEKYLKAIESGVDEEFGKRPEMLYPLDESVGPFYCVRIIPAIDTTLGAIPVNAKCQVLTDDKTVIDGLYAVGQDASNFWGNSYYQTEHTNALTQGWSITSGRLAGIAIAESYGKEVPFVIWESAKGN